MQQRNAQYTPNCSHDRRLISLADCRCACAAVTALLEEQRNQTAQCWAATVVHAVDCATAALRCVQSLWHIVALRWHRGAAHYGRLRMTARNVCIACCAHLQSGSSTSVCMSRSRALIRCAFTSTAKASSGLPPKSASQPLSRRSDCRQSSVRSRSSPTQCERNSTAHCHSSCLNSSRIDRTA
jgi:hypothetical protein